MVKEFEDLLLSTKREGMDKLIEFIRKSDFYKAPASTRHHLCREGGLLEHSMNVYKCLAAKRDSAEWKEVLSGVPEESIIIAALLHDLCKVYYYVVNYRSKKNDDGTLEEVPYYTVDDRIPYGHGEKSVMMVETYIKLRPSERYAIRWHMGFSEPKENYKALSSAFSMYPLALALHESDLEATYLLEGED